jgi:hypothetical protein
MAYRLPTIIQKQFHMAMLLSYLAGTLQLAHACSESVKFLFLLAWFIRIIKNVFTLRA